MANIEQLMRKPEFIIPVGLLVLPALFLLSLAANTVGAMLNSAGLKKK